MKIKYKLKEIYKGIFLVTIKDAYDLAMTFCRLQEFYESTFKQIRGKTFTICDFQTLYAKKFGDGVFTYPADWAGFNVPGHTMDEFMSITFSDWGNRYDLATEDIYFEIKDKHGTGDTTNPYYIIGSEPKDHETIDHEICHALYYLDGEYKSRVNYLLGELDSKLLNHFKCELLRKGYSKPVLMDEVNAYMCFDSNYLMTDMREMNKREKKNFEAVQLKLKSLFVSTLSVRKSFSN